MANANCECNIELQKIQFVILLKWRKWGCRHYFIWEGVVWRYGVWNKWIIEELVHANGCLIRSKGSTTVCSDARREMWQVVCVGDLVYRHIFRWRLLSAEKGRSAMLNTLLYARSGLVPRLFYTQQEYMGYSKHILLAAHSKNFVLYVYGIRAQTWSQNEGCEPSEGRHYDDGTSLAVEQLIKQPRNGGWQSRSISHYQLVVIQIHYFLSQMPL